MLGKSFLYRLKVLFGNTVARSLVYVFDIVLDYYHYLVCGNGNILVFSGEISRRLIKQTREGLVKSRLLRKGAYLLCAHGGKSFVARIFEYLFNLVDNGAVTYGDAQNIRFFNHGFDSFTVYRVAEKHECASRKAGEEYADRKKYAQYYRPCGIFSPSLFGHRLVFNGGPDTLNTVGLLTAVFAFYSVILQRGVTIYAFFHFRFSPSYLFLIYSPALLR